jgi:hypothetical protein
MYLLIFSFWKLLYFLLHQDEEMSALDQLRKRENKREAGLRKQKEKEKKEEKKL